jgi:hypothetical protein
MKSQTDRVLAVLQARGSEGTYQGEWFQDAPDGLGPITRLTSRITDLKAAGYQIATRPKTERRKFTTYYLASSSPVTPAPVEHEPDPDAERDRRLEDAYLFEPPEPLPAKTTAVDYYKAGA